MTKEEALKLKPGDLVKVDNTEGWKDYWDGNMLKLVKHTLKVEKHPEYLTATEYEGRFCVLTENPYEVGWYFYLPIQSISVVNKVEVAPQKEPRF